MKPIFHKISFIFGCMLLFQITGFAQANTDAGIKLYQDGKYSEAAQTLKGLSKKDPQAAYYLGLSYEKLGQTQEAATVYKKSVDAVVYQIGQRLIKLNSGTRKLEQSDSESYLRGLMGHEISSAFESSLRIKEIDPKIGGSEDWIIKNLILDMYRAKTVDPNPASAFTPLKIISSPFPSYTAEARKANVSGNVKLLIFFLSNGNIGPVFALNNLPYGLTENAIDASRRIKFTPATRGGSPVNVIKVMDYSFTIY